jgi:regulation of enolase protein 1 (concanavalin A-like superfamily)
VVRPEAGDLNGTVNTAKNLLVQPAAGDWNIESKLDFSAVPSANNQQAGIIAYQDDDNYLRLGLEYSGGSPRLALTTEDNLSVEPLAQPQVLASLPVASLLEEQQTIWLRMVKTGPRYRAYWSKDGRTFHLVYETGAALRNVAVGLFGFNRAGTTTDLSVGFDYFRVDNGPTPAAPPAGGSGPGTKPAVRKPAISRKAVRVNRKRQATLRVRCGVTRGNRCRGQVTVVSRRVVAAERSFSVRPNRMTAVRVKLGKPVYRRLVRNHRIKVRVTVLTRGADGQLRRAAVQLTLLAPKRRG